MLRSDLPPLDAHAHIAGDVTQGQLDALGDAVVLAMTRSPNEARYALRPGAASSPNVVWALGAHPGVPASLNQFDPVAFEGLVDRFAVVGEVGLDRRGPRDQVEVFDAVLSAAADRKVLLSVHSSGRCAQTLDAVEQHAARGVILHWFNGSITEVNRAVAAGCWFSVNAAMSDAILGSLPLDRVLTETDFPSSLPLTMASRPGDVHEVESRLLALHGTDIRIRVWDNFATLVRDAADEHKLPVGVQQVLTSL